MPTDNDKTSGASHQSQGKVAERRDSVGSLVKNDNISAAILALIEMMKNFFNGNKPYRDDPESQRVTLSIIEELGKKSGESIEQGNYTEGYLYARQQAYFESFHEAIMSPDVTDKKTAVAVASALSEEKIQELDQKDFAQVAKNEYSDMSEGVLGGIHQNVSSEVAQLIENNYAKAPQQMLQGIIGNDLNNLIEERSSTLTPAEKNSGIDHTASKDFDDNLSASKDVNNDRDMDSPSSGPGR